MPDDLLPYSNRELREKWSDMERSFGDLRTQMAVGFTRVEGKQDTTNGRVKDLELSRAKNDGFNRAAAISGTAAWTVAMAITGWVLIQIISLQSTLDSKIQTAVNTALSNYDINK
ncbi:MAG: hypothetical protein WC657_06430 [Candidatus Paceibacterota bacterium]|jgi:hypothetical protein